MSRLFLISVLLLATVVFPLFAFAADPVVVPAKFSEHSITSYSEFIVSGKSYFSTPTSNPAACVQAGGVMGTYEGTVHVYGNKCYFSNVQAVWVTHTCSDDAGSSYSADDIRSQCLDSYICPPADYPLYTVQTDVNGQQPVPGGHYCKKPDCSGISGAVDYGTYTPMGFNGTDTFGCVNECQVKTQSISSTVNGSGPWATFVYTGEACYTVTNPNENGTSGATGTENGTSGATGTENGTSGATGTENGTSGATGTENGTSGATGTENGTSGATGTGNGSGSGTGSGSGAGDGDGECTGDDCSVEDPVSSFCKNNPTALACVKLGDPTSSQVIENEVVNVKFSASSWGAENAACPAPVHIRDDVYFSYQPACDFFSGIRPVVIAAAFVIAALIVIGAGKGGDD